MSWIAHQTYKPKHRFWERFADKIISDFAKADKKWDLTYDVGETGIVFKQAQT